MTHVLAIFAAPRGDTPAATEWLRILAALRAVGIEVLLLETGAGVGVLAGELSPDGERYRDALAEEGVVATTSDDLRARIEAASDVIVLGDSSRTPSSSLVRWDDVRALPDAAERALAAGAFVRR